MKDEFTFDPAVHRVPEPEPLDNTERKLLRDLAQPGLPLWKVLRQFTDYQSGLKESLGDPEQDLEDVAVRRNFAKVQNAIAACTQLMNMFEQTLQLEPEKTP